MIKAVSLALVVCFSLPAALQAQTQSDEQQVCILKMNKDGANVAAAQAKLDQSCVKQYARGKIDLSSLTACVATDSDKLSDKKQTSVDDDAELCSTQTPAFAYAGAAAVNAAAQSGEKNLLSDLFGATFAGVAVCETAPELCKCQAKVLKKVEGIMATTAKVFQKCKKTALATAVDYHGIADCIEDSTLEDSIPAQRASEGRIAKTVAKMGDTIAKSCDEAGVSATAFSGACAGLSADTLRDCLARTAACRSCETATASDALNVNCDAFDDGIANASCSTSLIFKRAFVSSTYYQGALGGIAGADAKCQTLANGRSLGGTWVAWLSDSSTNARDRVSDVEYRLLDGSVIATHKADLLDGTLLHTINVNELGAVVTSTENPWTGTDDSGIATSDNCTGWTAAAVVKGSTGNSRSTAGWSSGSSTGCSFSQPLFCFEQ